MDYKKYFYNLFGGKSSREIPQQPITIEKVENWFVKQFYVDLT